MSRYLTSLTTDCVALRLSLARHRQGCAVSSLSNSLVSQSPSPTVRSRFFSAINFHDWTTSIHNRTAVTAREMGASASKGKNKYKPNKQPGASVEHAKFASGDTQVTNGDYVEGIVCKENDLEENQMKVVELGDNGGKVLLVRQKGKISALGAKCTHYGAPLVNGALGDGRVRCQWHGACFNIANGDIEDFPGLDSLPCYEVTVQNGNVKVRAQRQHLETNKRVKEHSRKDLDNETTFIVVGGGPAGANCVETLRQNGYTGRLVLITAEPYLPYDRIKLSKALDVNVNKITLRSNEFYSERDIEVLLSTELTQLNPAEKLIQLSDGQELKYDKIFLATGSSPRQIFTNGSDLENIFVLRTVDDANRIQNSISPSTNVVILGSSFIGLEAASVLKDRVKSVTVVAIEKLPFELILGADIGRRIQDLFEISVNQPSQPGKSPWLWWDLCVVAGMEAAAFCVDKVHSVTVIGKDDVPFKPSLGPIIGARVLKLFEEKGVHFRLEQSILEFEGEDGKLTSITLKDGSKLPADICLVGIGVVPNTNYLSAAGVKLQPNGAIEVNEFLETELPGVYAGGDIATAPVLGKKAAIGHWGLANYHGHIAALNMLGLKKPLNTVPFFWTVLFGKSFRYTGFAQKFDDVVIVGDVTELKFVAFYCVGDTVAAVTTINRDPVAAKFAELLHEGKQLSKSKINTWLS